MLDDNGERMRRRLQALAFVFGCATAAVAGAAPEVDLLTFAEGAMPLRIEADASARVRMEFAIAAIDGSPTGFGVSGPVAPDTRLAFVYELPAPTVFERFRVPDVLETPSPRQTFVRDVAIYGSATSASDGFVQLASGTLAKHAKRGEFSELDVQRRDAVRWVRLELSGGLDTPVPKVWLEFSEIIGIGRQQPAPLFNGFGGDWKGKGLKLTLRQNDASVSGCYDHDGRLEGSVSGNLLRATGKAASTGVKSAFIAAVRSDGSLQLLRSTNGAPFKLYTGASGAGGASCGAPAKPVPGCGSVLHGIRFEFDSATLNPDSAALLDALYGGLKADPSARIEIEGHTSAEGEAAYNQKLSEKRAQAVVDELTRRGLSRERLSASGKGEAQPIAPNGDESGRSLNRRVEIHCVA